MDTQADRSAFCSGYTVLTRPNRLQLLAFSLDHVFVSVKFPRRLSTELLAFLHCFLRIVWSNVETRQIYGSLANIL